jgi:hypothetical protein
LDRVSCVAKELLGSFQQGTEFGAGEAVVDGPALAAAGD